MACFSVTLKQQVTLLLKAMYFLEKTCSISIKLNCSQYICCPSCWHYSAKTFNKSGCNCHQHGLKHLLPRLLPLKGQRSVPPSSRNAGELSCLWPWVSLVHLSPLDSAMCEVTQWRHRIWSHPLLTQMVHARMLRSTAIWL